MSSDLHPAAPDHSTLSIHSHALQSSQMSPTHQASSFPEAQLGKYYRNFCLIPQCSCWLQGLAVRRGWRSSTHESPQVGGRVNTCFWWSTSPSCLHVPSLRSLGVPQSLHHQIQHLCPVLRLDFSDQNPHTISPLYSFSWLFISWVSHLLLFPSHSHLCSCAGWLPHGTGVIFQPSIPSPLLCN